MAAPQKQPRTQARNINLELAPNLNVHPDLILGNGNGIFCIGAQGTGKSVILKLIMEQSAQKANIPIVAFDREEDLKATVEYFPRGVIGTYRNCPTARDIFEEGLQVVYDLTTWPNMDIAGQMIARQVNQLMREAERTPANLRVPCLVVLDEASYWLPQRRGSYLDEETFSLLNQAFDDMASRGRKRGLTPALFAQKISRVAKNVLSPGTYILMRQGVHTEQQCYLEYILPTGEFAYFTDRQKKLRINDLRPGEAIVKLANGEQVIAQFYECQSPHIAHTPKTLAALNRYGAKPFNPRASYGSYIEDEEMEVQADYDEQDLPANVVEMEAPADAPSPVVDAGKPAKKAKKTNMPTAKTIARKKAMLRRFLRANPDANPGQVSKELKISWETASKWLKEARG